MKEGIFAIPLLRMVEALPCPIKNIRGKSPRKKNEFNQKFRKAAL